MNARAITARPAALAELVNMVGEGLPLYLWTRMAEPGEDPWALGRRRAAREEGGFSYRNATMLESGREVVGGLIGYPLPARPEPSFPRLGLRLLLPVG